MHVRRFGLISAAAGGRAVHLVAACLALTLGFLSTEARGQDADPPDTFQAVAAIFEGRCITCHNSHGTSQGNLSLDRAAAAFNPPDRRPVIVPGEPDRSTIIQAVLGPEPKMPKRGELLSDEQVQAMRDWIAAGAPWPEGLELHNRPDISTDWWSLKPLKPQPIPQPAQHADWIRNPIDAFILEQLLEQGMRPSPEADRRTLIRRVYFDLIGLPPTPEQVEAFIADDDPHAYERVVDELLRSPHYGERWARHWMDVAGYAESHGHDEDAPRENAWPYRDYLIRAFNEEFPYSRFIEQQIAGDVLYPDDPQATVALGFLAAGSWDQSSQMGIQDGTHDKLVAQVLDRDGMISAAVGSLNSVTIACARCHNHKFDPVTQEDYYALQAVFAGVDRHDIPYDPDPVIHQRRRELEQRQQNLATLTNAELLRQNVQQTVAAWEHNQTESDNWQTLEPTDIAATHGSSFQKLDDHSILFAGDQEREIYTISAISPQRGITAVRLEVLTHPDLPEQGPGRAPNGNITLSDFQIHAAPSADAQPQQLTIARAFADFDQDSWTVNHAIDGNLASGWGIFPQVGQSHDAIFVLDEPIDDADATHLTFTLNQNHGGAHIIGRPRLSVTTSATPRRTQALPDHIAAILNLSPETRSPQQHADLARYVLTQRVEAELAALPAPQMVYAVTTDFPDNGNYVSAQGPRPVHVLHRGDIDQPGEPAQPGALSWLEELPARFELDNPDDESARRAALARWLSDDRNVMTWRSVVNRVWHYHFGRGIVATPDDFGRMGAEPTHPELLDFLALRFRDESQQSFKQLSRMIVTSATYRQTSTHQSDYAAHDAENRYLYRMNRRRLSAEQLTDAVLTISGQLDRTMGGPSVKQFVQSPGVHVTPNVDYQDFDPDDPANNRRAIYRFLMRTLPDPLMESLDCPTGSQPTPVRGDSVTPLQALAMMNNPFMIRQAEHLAARLAAQSTDSTEQVRHLYRLALNREPTELERRAITKYADDHSLAAACRLVFNTNAFMFLD